MIQGSYVGHKFLRERGELILELRGKKGEDLSRIIHGISLAEFDALEALDPLHLLSSEILKNKRTERLAPLVITPL